MLTNVQPDRCCRRNACFASRGPARPLVESRHRGHLAAVDDGGNTIASLGLPETVTYVRSSGKPFQAIPVIVSGAAKRFGFTEQEIAIACGSHSGESIHLDAVRSMLAKIGLDESALKCGVHEPFSAEVARQLARNQEPPNVLHNNCSGKHAAMLALAVHIGAATESYDDRDNPVQQMISRTFADFSGFLCSRLPLVSMVVVCQFSGCPFEPWR